jgi:tRNA(Ile)-lysidine synthase
MAPEPALIERFGRDLDALIARDRKIGIAVSGGPDSLALLLLAAASRPGLVEAASVDHALRPDTRAETEMVADVCGRLGVPHEVLTIEWSEPPSSALQERARDARYKALAAWLRRRRLTALLTAHHADDQAETFLMRLNRGSGVRGLAGMRPTAVIPGTKLPLLRPLLRWRRSELAQICADAALEPAADPSNDDVLFERVRVRRALAQSDLFDPAAVAQSAAHLAQADEALEWMAKSLALLRVVDDAGALRIDAQGLAAELQRRLVRIAFERFHAPEPRGPDLSRAIDALAGGRTVTLGGLKLEGGRLWRISRAPARRGRNGAVTDSTPA